MEKKYYICKNNVITGPFDRDFLLNMLQQNLLTLDDFLSTDKNSWQPLQKVLDLIVPDQDCTDAQPGSPYTASQTLTISSANETDCFLPLSDSKLPQQITLGDLLLTVIASLGNGGGYLMRLNQYTGNAMLLAGGIAAVYGLLFGVFGSLLFGGLYNISKISVCLRSLTVILLAGAFLWMFNHLVRLFCQQPNHYKAAEADFLTAMHGMMNIGALTALFNSFLFIFNSSLFDMQPFQIALTVAVVLLPLIFFTCNTVLSLRMNFMGNCNMRPGTAAIAAVVEFYLTTVSCSTLLYLLY